jgi:serine/threonine-protein kinase
MQADAKPAWGMAPLDPSVAGVQPGDVIAGKYRIEGIIGRGGMSVVYQATHLQLGQQVALKVLSAEALHLPEYILRLKREACAVSRIRSEHVTRVHDIGELEAEGGIPGVPYLVMEYLSGLDLAAVLSRRGALPVGLAVECIMQACEALAEAHALGIVHRDLKPANLFLTEGVDGSPCVKVLDFGISRMSTCHGLPSLTDPGTVLGTPSYMAPEQMEAADSIDARSDIWGLGIILYELLAGKPPYGGDSLPQIFIHIMRSRPPKPSLVRTDVPPAVDAIVARCLAIEPSDRFQSVADLARALSKVGTPRERTSAQRVARVFEKCSAEAGASMSEPLALLRGLERLWRRHRSALRKVAAALASAGILGAASVFGMLAARGAVDARARGVQPAARGASSTSDPMQTLPPDAVLTIMPMTRPSGGVPPAPIQVPAPATQNAPATMVAVSLPAGVLESPARKNTPPAPTTDAREGPDSGPTRVEYPPEAAGEAHRTDGTRSIDLD